MDNARTLIEQTFFNIRRYDLGPVGRYKLNKRLGLETEESTRTLQPDDLVAIVREIVRLNVTQGVPDHIDHLGNRRVRAVGELLADQFRVGLLRMERVIKERMSIPERRRGDAVRAHQHPAGYRRGEGVLWRQPALAVHGPGQSDGGTCP